MIDNLAINGEDEPRTDELYSYDFYHILFIKKTVSLLWGVGISTNVSIVSKFSERNITEN